MTKRKWIPIIGRQRVLGDSAVLSLSSTGQSVKLDVRYGLLRIIKRLRGVSGTLERWKYGSRQWKKALPRVEKCLDAEITGIIDAIGTEIKIIRLAEETDKQEEA